MRTLAALLAAVGLGLPACGSAESLPSSGNERPVTAAPHAQERTTAVYAEVIRQLVTKDHTFGSGPWPFRRVFVVDGVVPGAGRPLVPRRPASEPFPAAVKEGVERALGDLPPLRFVSDPDSVMIDRQECARVRDDGVLITLGPISEAGRRKVTVPNGLFFACLGGQWQTYVLERAHAAWRVVGTEGPVGIS